MAEKITIIETKLERIKSDDYEDDEIRFVTERIELDDLIKDKATSKISNMELDRSGLKSKAKDEALDENERKNMAANKKRVHGEIGIEVTKKSGGRLLNSENF